MILTESDAQERLESPLNLINRLRGGMTPAASRHRDRITHPALPPTADQLIPDLDTKINLITIKSKAADILVGSLDELKNRLSEVTKPSQLAAIASQMGKIVEGMEEKTKNDNRVGQIIIYAPRVVKEDEFETIDASTVD